MRVGKAVGPHAVHTVPPHAVHVFVNSSEVSIPEHCRTRWTGYDFDGNQNVGVALCAAGDGDGERRDMGQSGASGFARSGFAMCIPPLYGIRPRPRGVRRHIDHHRRLGVNLTFLYLTEQHGPWQGQVADLPNVHLLHLPWISRLRLFSRGQLWQINDCIHRSAAAGFRWALNIDADEWMFLRQAPPMLGRRWSDAASEAVPITLPELVVREASHGANVFTLGSRMYPRLVRNGTLACETLRTSFRAA